MNLCSICQQPMTKEQLENYQIQQLSGLTESGVILYQGHGACLEAAGMKAILHANSLAKETRRVRTSEAATLVAIICGAFAAAIAHNALLGSVIATVSSLAGIRLWASLQFYSKEISKINPFKDNNGK